MNGKGNLLPFPPPGNTDVPSPVNVCAIFVCPSLGDTHCPGVSPTVVDGDTPITPPAKPFGYRFAILPAMILSQSQTYFIAP